MEGKHWLWIAPTIIVVIAGLVGTIAFGDQLISDKLTYVSSTEYIAGDAGQVIVRLVNFQGTPLTATCTDTIQYPNKTAFLTSVSMGAGGFGNYYHNFTVPTQDGIYTSNVNCTYGAKTISQSKTFHISLLNSVMQSRFDALGINITTGHINILNSINDTRDNLSNLITQNYNTILSVNTNLSTQISNFESEVQDNFTTVINLIQAYNASEAADHDELLDLLIFINSTTTTTQTNLDTFQTETTNNFITVNNTINDVKTDTETIIDLLDNLTLDFNITIGNLSDEINYLINITNNNQETTQTNLSTIISFFKFS